MTKSDLGFNKRMLGSLFQIKKQTLRNERQKRKTEETPSKNLFQKGVDGQKQRKNGILKGKTKGKQGKKTEKEEKKQFKTGLLGEQNRNKNSKNCRKIAFLGLFTKQKHKNTGNNSKTKQTRKTPFAFWQTTPYFW